MIQHIEVNGVNLAYRFDGKLDAPVLMLSNSLMSNLSMWGPQVEAFTEKFRVLRYDSRGHGNSGVPPAPYSMDTLGEDAAALIDALDLKAVHFCGLSMGGMVGQYLGAKHGDKLSSLILCDTACVMPPPSLWNDRISHVREHGMAAAVTTTIERWFTTPFREAGSAVIGHVPTLLQKDLCSAV